jgi:hypothetical protein
MTGLATLGFDAEERKVKRDPNLLILVMAGVIIVPVVAPAGGEQSPVVWSAPR